MYVPLYTHNIVSAKLKPLNWGCPYPRFFWPSIQSQRVIDCEGWRLLYLTGKERPKLPGEGGAVSVGESTKNFQSCNEYHNLMIYSCDDMSVQFSC